MKEWFTPEKQTILIQSTLMLVIALPLIYFLAGRLRSILTRWLSGQHAMIVTKLFRYTALIILFAMVLNQLGFNLTALFGAAGILGVAIGFASKTSVSNMISGVFLMIERSFVVGDTIQVKSTTGTVLSIDLLSVKLKTADNRFVRLPNELLVKSEIINVTRYPKRRLDIILPIDHDVPLSQVKVILANLLDSYEWVLNDPEPNIMISELGADSHKLQISVWVKKEDFGQLKQALTSEIEKIFKVEGISFSRQHIQVHDKKTGTKSYLND